MDKNSRPAKNIGKPFFPIYRGIMSHIGIHAFCFPKNTLHTNVKVSLLSVSSALWIMLKFKYLK